MESNERLFAGTGIFGTPLSEGNAKTAFETELIANGHDWLEALKNSNLTSHTYDEEVADKVVALIRNSYYGLLQELSVKLKSEI